MNTTLVQRPLMAHLVLGYPDMATSLATAAEYVRAGCAILELQIPFSHPTADGPVITHACQQAVQGGQATVDDCLDAIQTLRNQFPDQEIIVMTYLNRAFTYGVAALAARLNALGITQAIIPDLPADSVLADQFRKAGLNMIPVIAANVPEARLSRLLKLPFNFIYLMSDFKITGSAFSLHPRLEKVLQTIKAERHDVRTGIGFGISTREQVELVTSVANYAILGSSLLKAQEEGRLAAYLGGL